MVFEGDMKFLWCGGRGGGIGIWMKRDLGGGWGGERGFAAGGGGEGTEYGTEEWGMGMVGDGEGMGGEGRGGLV